MQAKLNSAPNNGEISSIELKDGPLSNRRCTDILCCLLFTAFLGAFVALLGVSIT